MRVRKGSRMDGTYNSADGKTRKLADMRAGNGAAADASLPKMSLRELVASIVADTDREALEELLTARRVPHGDNRWLRIPDYLCHLWSQLTGVPAAVADRAYDISLDRFTSLPAGARDPNQDTASDVNAGVALKHKGPDCRFYYGAFLRHLEEAMPRGLTELEEEIRAAHALRHFIDHHFHLCVAEAKRRFNPRVHRYTWKRDEGRVTLYMPRSMGGMEKRRWLEENIERPDLSLPDERARIQRVVDRRLNDAWTGPGAHRGSGKSASADHPQSWWPVTREVATMGLPQTLANEKAGSIGELRPRIRALGPDRLHQLILDIFERIKNGAYEEGKLAQAYGLSLSLIHI